MTPEEKIMDEAFNLFAEEQAKVMAQAYMGNYEQHGPPIMLFGLTKLMGVVVQNMTQLAEPATIKAILEDLKDLADMPPEAPEPPDDDSSPIIVN